MHDRKNITCGGCGRELDESPSAQNTHPCSHCGSVKRIITIHLHDVIPTTKEMLLGKVNDRSRPSRDNPRIDFMTGDEQRKSDGKWMKKRRHIDKDKDEYFEQVVDSETGETVHECRESLSEHTGHGSAKKK